METKPIMSRAAGAFDADCGATTKEAAHLHRNAMGLASQAELARLQGDLNAAQRYARQAFEQERAAAQLMPHDRQSEPTRSVLHLSAASLAFDCGEPMEAERLIATALAGDPPIEIANELRDLLGRCQAN